MKILALDTATEACAVALTINGEMIERQVMGRQHAERLLELIEELLAEAGLKPTELDAIAFGRGPGMFTGLRIGAGVTQGIAFAADLPVVPVSTLRALAQGQDADRVLAALDARMGQVYWCCFVRGDDGFMEPVSEERVDSPRVVMPPAGRWVGAGSGWDQYTTELLPRLQTQVSAWRANAFPSAVDLARLGERGVSRGLAISAELAIPVYVRDDVARKSARQGIQ
jgi:tRNA threonylcarbamoyladenosine biosynthesis protein TsaB